MFVRSKKQAWAVIGVAVAHWQTIWYSWKP